MNIYQQTCTKEQSLRLVELGVKAVALFYHMRAKDGPHGEYIQYGWHSDNLAPAYNVAELMDMLPEWIEGDRLTVVKDNALYSDLPCYTVGYNGGDGYFSIGHGTDSLAEAAAGCLIILLEKKKYDLPTHWRQDPNDHCADGRCKLSYSKDMEEIQPLPIPVDEETRTPAFNAVWNMLKGCTITMPEYYKGYRQVTGRHVKLIVDAIKGAKC